MLSIVPLLFLYWSSIVPRVFACFPAARVPHSYPNRMVMRGPEAWNPACRRKRSGLEYCEMKAAEALQAPVRGAEVWPLSVEAYHALGEAGLIPERTELLYGFVYHKMSKSPLHTFLVLRLLRLLQAVLPPGLYLRPEQPLTCVDSEPEPDLAVVFGSEEAFRQAHPRTAELVIEVCVSTRSMTAPSFAPTPAPA